jgi:elongation factor 1-gamma
MTLYGNPKHFATLKCLAAAECGGTKLTVKDEHPPKDKMPFNGRPCYVNDKTALMGSTPICWHVSGGKLRGQKKEDESDVLCWMNAAETLYRPAIMAWVLPATSCMALDKQSFDAARADCERLLDILNNILLHKTFLVGERMSLADLSLAFDLKPAYEHVLEPGMTVKYANMTRWFMTVMHQPEVAKVVGTITLCEKESHFDAKLYAANSAKMTSSSTTRAATSAPTSAEKPKDTPDKKDKKGKDATAPAAADEKKAEKKAKPAKKEEDDAEEMDECEAALAGEPEQKDPFATMPKGTFDMDAFKRCYSNEDTLTKAIPHFWANFDKANYSIWFCEYKFPQELTIVFMSCNLISGMFQRLDKMRKCAFGSMCLFGTDNNSTISGVWMWRGQDLAFKLSPDWQIDYESYDWKKLDPDAESTKKTVKEYLMWEGDFGGKKFNQGKIFK